FILGFVVLVAACSLSQRYKGITKALTISVGLILCHAIGTCWFSVISGEGIWASFVCASLPYLAKDVICVVFADKSAGILKRVYKLDM
ncbi:MAG: biotin transporter BioY, partial [Clostridiales bacterium]|nr:biotin transporter BioY [Clostridiales bacterium]